MALSKIPNNMSMSIKELKRSFKDMSIKTTKGSSPDDESKSLILKEHDPNTYTRIKEVCLSPEPLIPTGKMTISIMGCVKAHTLRDYTKLDVCKLTTGVIMSEWIKFLGQDKKGAEPLLIYTYYALLDKVEAWKKERSTAEKVLWIKTRQHRGTVSVNFQIPVQVGWEDCSIVGETSTYLKNTTYNAEGDKKESPCTVISADKIFLTMYTHVTSLFPQTIGSEGGHTRMPHILGQIKEKSDSYKPIIDGIFKIQSCLDDSFTMILNKRNELLAESKWEEM